MQSTAAPTPAKKVKNWLFSLYIEFRCSSTIASETAVGSMNPEEASSSPTFFGMYASSAPSEWSIAFFKLLDALLFLEEWD